MNNSMVGRKRSKIPMTDMRRPRTADLELIPPKKQTKMDSGMVRILPVKEAPRNTFAPIDPQNRAPSY